MEVREARKWKRETRRDSRGLAGRWTEHASQRGSDSEPHMLPEGTAQMTYHDMAKIPREAQG